MAAAALSFVDPQFARDVADAFPCQGLPHDFVEFASRFVARSVVHPEKPKPKDIGMHYGAITKTLGERVSAALTKRLFPHTNLTRKQLQHALGISIGTMDNLLSGHHDPSGRILDKLVSFFRESFINEIWGGHNIHCVDTRAVEKAVVVAQLVAAHAELRRLG
jgi:hypothetical protein